MPLPMPPAPMKPKVFMLLSLACGRSGLVFCCAHCRQTDGRSRGAHDETNPSLRAERSNLVPHDREMCDTVCTARHQLAQRQTINPRLQIVDNSKRLEIGFENGSREPKHRRIDELPRIERALQALRAIDSRQQCQPLRGAWTCRVPAGSIGLRQDDDVAHDRRIRRARRRRDPRRRQGASRRRRGSFRPSAATCR